MKKQRLELTWTGKDERLRLEPRILVEDSALSYHASIRMSDGDIFENMLIQGDNLLALKALETEFSSKIGCIYIDPPYNTGSAFPSYDDNLEHSLWLSHIRERLEVLWHLLKEGGALLISINDDEAHYLKVLCDELFGRSAFKATLIWNTEGNTDNQSKIIRYHEYILVYAKGELRSTGVIDPNIAQGSKLNKDEIRNTIVKNGPKNPPSLVTLPVGFPCSIEMGSISKRDNKWPQILDDVDIESGRLSMPSRFYSGWSSREILLEFIENGFSPVLDSKGQQTTFELTRNGTIEAVKVREADKGHFVSVLRGFGTTNQMRLLLEKIGLKFSFPKPIGLIKYLLAAFSEPDDIILDSYAGSGTTGHAVLELNRERGSSRRFILVEQFSETAERILAPRLKAVVSGDQRAEIAPTGGGFRYYRLAPSLLEKDRFGNWIIAKQYNAAMLAEAVCKLMGFTYDPSQKPEDYWRHGHSSEMDFIYVTTQSLTHDALKKLADEVGPDRTLLLCCKAFNAREAAFLNLTIKKIPQTVMSKCEWGCDDYSLAVSNLPIAEAVESQTVDDEDTPADTVPKPCGRRRKVASDEPSLFSDVEAK